MSQKQQIKSTSLIKSKKINYIYDMPTVYNAPITKITNQATDLKINNKIDKKQIDKTQINKWGYSESYPFREIDMIQMDVWGFTFDYNLKNKSTQK